MTRFSLAERPPANDTMSRGSDTSDLVRLRERIEKHQEQQLAEAEVSADIDRWNAGVRVQEQREAARVEAEARSIEAQGRARWMRVFSLQAVVGLGAFVVAEILLLRRAGAEKAG